MSRRKKPPPLKKFAVQMQEQLGAARRTQQLTQALDDDGYPPGHPLRTMALLLSGDAGRARHVFEQTQGLLKRPRG